MSFRRLDVAEQNCSHGKEIHAKPPVDGGRKPGRGARAEASGSTAGN